MPSVSKPVQATVKSVRPCRCTRRRRISVEAAARSGSTRFEFSSASWARRTAGDDGSAREVSRTREYVNNRRNSNADRDMDRSMPTFPRHDDARWQSGAKTTTTTTTKTTIRPPLPTIPAAGVPAAPTAAHQPLKKNAGDDVRTIIAQDGDRRRAKVMRLIERISHIPHGMDIGIALQPAVLSDNQELRIPPRQILEAAETHLGDLRAMEIWSWIERQYIVAGSYHDKKSVQEFVDASRKAILLCGKLGLANRAESTAKRVINDFGALLSDDDDEHRENIPAKSEIATTSRAPQPALASSPPASSCVHDADIGSAVLGSTGYAGLAAAYARSNDIDKLVSLWQSLQNDASKASSDVYSEIFKGLVASWRIDDAIVLAREAEEKGLAIQKSAWHEGLTIFCSPVDPLTVDRCATMGRYSVSLLNAMTAAGHAPPHASLQAILSFLIGEKARDNWRIVDDIAEVFHISLLNGYEPDAQTYGDIIFLLGKALRFQDALELYLSLSGRTSADTPPMDMCLPLLEAAFEAERSGRFDASSSLSNDDNGIYGDDAMDDTERRQVSTMKLYSSLRNAGLEPNAKMYGIVARACALHAGGWETIYELIEEMRQDGFYPTSPVLCAALASLRDARMERYATELVEQQERVAETVAWKRQCDELEHAEAISLGLNDAAHSEYVLTLITCGNFRRASSHVDSMVRRNVALTQEAVTVFFDAAHAEEERAELLAKVLLTKRNRKLFEKVQNVRQKRSQATA